MGEKEEVVNINFFKKVWYSITKFEKYPVMAAEGFGKALTYLIILTSIVTVFAVIGSLLQMNKIVSGLAGYIQENIPEFSYGEGKVTMEIEEPIVIKDVKYKGIDKIVVNPLAENAEQKEQSEKDELINGTTIFFFKDEIILEGKAENGEIAKQSYTYSDFIANYTGENIESFNKSDLVEYITSQKMMPFYSRYGLSIFVYLLMVNVIVAMLDAFEIALLGWITASIARIKMKFIAMYNMAVHALTLPMLLNILYIIINYFTKFTINYFQVAYIAIAYIYLAATIFIIKDDLIKKMQEVEKIKQEQKNIKEEIKEQEEKKEEKPEEKKEDKDNKEDKKEDEEGEEPQGSEA